MKINFKKVTAIVAGALMTVSAAGFALAASYPAPFISNGTADVAIVYGTGTGVSSLDLVQAGNIQSDLQSRMGTTTTSANATVSGGDSVAVERSSTKFELGKGVSDVWSTSLGSSELPTLLADGKYLDSANNEKAYTQKIDLANLTLSMFDDNDYKEYSPTVGFRIASGSHVLNYTLSFTDEPKWAEIDTTTLHILGKDYFVLSHTANTTINLLDSANTATVAEGDSKTVTVNGKTYDVSIEYISSSEVKLTINGETTNSLAQSETQRLTDGSYVGIKDIMYNSKTGTISSVEFSIGTGKLVLTSGQDIELNDDSISGLKSYITTTSSSNATINKIVLSWDVEDDSFITPDSSLTMPGFKAVKLTTTGMYFPDEEKISLKAGSSTYAELYDFPMKTSTETIALLYGNSTNYTGIGKDSTNKLATSGTTTLDFNKTQDAYFVASYNDGSNAESYLMRATNFGLVSGSSTANQTTIQYRKDGTWTDLKKDARAGDSVSIGNVQFDIDTILGSGYQWVNLTAGTSVEFNTLYSKDGMKVYLPWTNSTSGSGPGEINLTSVQPSTYNLIFSEEDKNGVINNSNNVTATIGWNSASTPQTSITGVSGGAYSNAQDGDGSKIYDNYVVSPLATKIVWDKSADQYELDLTYHGDESYGNLYVSSPSATISGSTSSSGLGDVLVKDSEVASVSTKNLIIVGGSCINSAAATVLGGAYCGAAFTTATNVGAGQFLIKGVNGAYTTGKLALVVAGYDAADTVNAATYLRTQSVDTSKEYVGTSSTSATLVTTTA